MEPCCDICKNYNPKKGICKLTGEDVGRDSYCDWFEDNGDFIEDDVFSEYMDFYDNDY